MDSTFLKKQFLPLRIYKRLGASARSLILQGIADYGEPVCELPVTELKAKLKQGLEKTELEEINLADAIDNGGCS